MSNTNKLSHPSITADLIIEARWIATAVSNQPVLENHAVIVSAGLIVEILAIADARQKYSTTSLVCLDDHVLIPGLINLHTHAAMSLMRGIADDIALMPWLNDHIWPAERAVVSERYVKDASLLASAEMLSGGITCFNDMYFYPQATAAAASQAGIRANLGLVVMEFHQHTQVMPMIICKKVELHMMVGAVIH